MSKMDTIKKTIEAARKTSQAKQGMPKLLKVGTGAIAFLAAPALVSKALDPTTEKAIKIKSKKLADKLAKRTDPKSLTPTNEAKITFQQIEDAINKAKDLKDASDKVRAAAKFAKYDIDGDGIEEADEIDKAFKVVRLARKIKKRADAFKDKRKRKKKKKKLNESVSFLQYKMRKITDKLKEREVEKLKKQLEKSMHEANPIKYVGKVLSASGKYIKDNPGRLAKNVGKGVLITGGFMALDSAGRINNYEKEHAVALKRALSKVKDKKGPEATEKVRQEYLKDLKNNPQKLSSSPE